MHIEIFKLKFVNVKNNFLHFTPTPFSNLAISSVRALKADSQEGSTFYFSPHHSPYTGLLDDDCVGISAVYARALGLEEDQHLVISTINNLGSIKRLHVSPWTADDLEIVCSASTVLESQLLGQLRIVWPKQVFCAWISNNISVNFIIDSLSPELQFGRLEEYTEIVVNFEPAKKTTPKSDDPQIPRYLRRFFASTDRDPVQSTQVRCIPLTDSIKKLYKLDRIPPFAVYATKTKALLPSKLPNLWKLVRTTENGLLEVFVQLFFLDNLSFRRKSRWAQLFVSDGVQSHLNLQIGAKVELTPVEDVHLHESINAILISPRFPFKNSPEDELRLVDEVRNTLMDHALCHASVLLNNKGEVTLRSGKSVQLTLRPLSLTWSFLSNSTVRDISLSCNEFNPDSLRSVSLDQKHNETDLWGVVIDSNEKLLEKLNLTDASNAHLQANVLIIGKSGSGKTGLSQTLLNRFSDDPTFFYQSRVDFLKLKGKRIEVVVRELNDALKDAVDHQPSVLLLEDIDTIASLPNPDHAGTEATLHINKVAHKLVEILEECQRINSVSLIGTATSTTSVHPRIFSDRGKSLFSSCVHIPEYSRVRRKEILTDMIVNKAPASNKDELELERFANLTEGFLMADLVKLVKVAFFKAWQRKVTERANLEILKDDLEEAFSSTKPSYLEGIDLLKEKKHSWSTVGGLETAKAKIIEVILWPTKYPHIMSQCPLKPQTGILIYGAPGTGKTILARAAAKESSLNFITVKGPELMSKYIGQSEEGVRNVFEKAQAAKPCLLFFDEFESLAPRRGKDQTGVTDRVVNQLLTALDGVDPLHGVFVMAATSRPDLVDPALLRPGRIGTSVLCPFPDVGARAEILSALASQIELDDDVNFSVMAEATEGFSGADLKGLLSAAQLKVIDNIVQENSVDGKELEVVLSSVMEHHQNMKLKQEHLFDALRDCKPSLSPSEKEKYRRIYEDFMKPSFVDVSSQKVTLA